MPYLKLGGTNNFVSLNTILIRSNLFLILTGIYIFSLVCLTFELLISLLKIHLNMTREINLFQWHKNRAHPNNNIY